MTRQMGARCVRGVTPKMKERPLHKVLKCRFNGSPAAWIRTYEQDFLGLERGYEDVNPQMGRAGDIRAALGMVTLHHLGHDTGIDVGQRLQAGADVAFDYFTGDWWKSNELARQALDKSKSRRGLHWLKAFAEGMLLLLLARRIDDAAAISEWVEHNLVAELCGEEYTYDDQAKELGDVYKYLASHLREDPLPRVDLVEKRLKRAYRKRPRLLYDAIKAVGAGDEAEYQKHLGDLLARFHRRLGQGANPIQWVATHESVVALFAESRGLAPPELDSERLALLLQPESIA